MMKQKNCSPKGIGEQFYLCTVCYLLPKGIGEQFYYCSVCYRKESVSSFISICGVMRS